MNNKKQRASHMNGAQYDALELIAKLMETERLRKSSHFSKQVYRSEPILTTGRQMKNYLPECYRKMHEITRRVKDEATGEIHWISEEEQFYKQAVFMKDVVDDCPYNGSFKAYFPTYEGMSDRRLRGYFTWRAQVRKGVIEETSLAFVYLYFYELINGIGVRDALDGFHKIENFWQSYREIAPEIDHYASTWLQDYVVYHGLPVQLLEPYKTLAFDRSLLILRNTEAHACGLPESQQVDSASARHTYSLLDCNFDSSGNMHVEPRDGSRPSQSKCALANPIKLKKGVSAFSLPVNEQKEDELLFALDALSTYRVLNSRFYKEHPEAFRHVACAVFARMCIYHVKQRKSTLLESWFGDEVALSYTMFGSVVFFEAHPHANAVYELNDIHKYTCKNGRWTCERFHGSRSKNSKLGSILRACDISLRKAYDFAHPLKEKDTTPKYLQKFIDDEIAIWTKWEAEHAPRKIEIDVTQLAGIRSAAALTRESLLIDEERAEDSTQEEGRNDKPAQQQEPAEEYTATQEQKPTLSKKCNWEQVAEYGEKFDQMEKPKPEEEFRQMQKPEPEKAGILHAESAPMASQNSLLSPAQAAYLQALLCGDATAQASAIQAANTSEDLLVDAINDALFDEIGDTVIEYGANGPQLINDYREDVEGILAHVS